MARTTAPTTRSYKAELVVGITCDRCGKDAAHATKKAWDESLISQAHITVNIEGGGYHDFDVCLPCAKDLRDSLAANTQTKGSGE